MTDKIKDIVSEGNKLIAEFMGWNENDILLEFHNGGAGHVRLSEMMYHTSWDWLMHVVEKIEKMLFVVEIKENRCFITGYREYENVLILYKDSSHSKIQATWQAVVEFVKWYNKNK